MSTALHRGLHVALNDTRVFGLVGGALLFEALIRFALAVGVHPVAAVLWPPVIALPLLGAGAPEVRKLVDGRNATPEWTLGPRLREVGPRLLGVAVAGHLVGLVLGTSAFLIVDTAVRVVVYAVGESVPTGVVLVVPLAGVAAGTLIAWGLLVPAVARRVAGESRRAAAVASVATLADRRRTASALALHGGVVLAVVALVGLCVGLANQRYGTQEAALFAFATMIAVGVALLVVLGVFVYPIHIALAIDSRSRRPAVPVGKLALTALLVTGLIVGASAVRVTETRPMAEATGATPLPADSTAAYAAAVERTAATDHRFTQTQGRADSRLVFSAAVERSSRHVTMSISSEGRSFEGYADSGVVYALDTVPVDFYTLGERRVDDRRVRSLPGYWTFRSEYDPTALGGFGLPDPSTGEWETVGEENGTKTVELTGDAAVFDSVLPVGVETVSAETAWVRMRVDTERGVVRGGRARLNGTYNGYTGNSIDRGYNYTVETGPTVDAHRPDALGSRSVGEWMWDIFAY